jgi:hypothetical protein
MLKVLVRKEYAALIFLHKFAKNNIRLMRRRLRLPEFDFDIEHVPGTKIRHVDALSRHVGLVEKTNCLSKERILKEQDKDPFCEKQKKNGLEAKGEFFRT